MSKSELYPSIIPHNATPHELGFMGGNVVYQLPVDELFCDGHAVRASEQRDQIGTLNFLTANIPMEFPVDEIKITDLEDENGIRTRIDRVRESDPESAHIILVSQIAYAALRFRNFPTEITPENPVGFGIPAGIRRDSEGRILYAERIDQPQSIELPPWDAAEIAHRRNQLLNAGDYMVRAHNYTPTDLVVGSAFMRRTAITQPDYGEPSAYAYTSTGTPITRPTLQELWDAQWRRR